MHHICGKLISWGGYFFGLTGFTEGVGVSFTLGDGGVCDVFTLGDDVGSRLEILGSGAGTDDDFF